jgi:hypothetical protein
MTCWLLSPTGLLHIIARKHPEQGSLATILVTAIHLRHWLNFIARTGEPQMILNFWISVDTLFNSLLG